MLARWGMALFLNFIILISIAEAEIERPTDAVVFEEKGNIFLKSRGQVTQLTDTGRDSEPVLSPDGRWIAFNREIEGKAKECSERNDLWACPSDELWIYSLDPQTEKLLLEPRPDVPQKRTEDVIYQFNGKQFSPDSRTIYFVTPAWVVSGAIHAVNIDGSHERYVMHGYSFHVVRAPLPENIKKYLIEELQEDDWRIFPKKEGLGLIKKALNDDVIGFLLIERSGIRTISTPTLQDYGWKSDDGKYYVSMGRSIWTELISPDGSMKIPIEKER
ncbi:MAG: hypothetical protein COV67_02630 [Nitrospinae bacterium CG11_big_fil_rev_8_21_14_0_20_56_8]|nr:MAG: hypothetical protein COV67_02630 [Nitrospinae bacterium CG11_big_fil_rev_8_21_14_0_20_56_8]